LTVAPPAIAGVLRTLVMKTYPRVLRITRLGTATIMEIMQGIVEMVIRHSEGVQRWKQAMRERIMRSISAVERNANRVRGFGSKKLEPVDGNAGRFAIAGA